MIYLFVLFYLCIVTYIFDVRQARVRKSFFYGLSYIVLVCLAALRYRVGGDTLNYMWRFDNIPPLNELSLFNIGHSQPIPTILMSYCKHAFDEFAVYQAIVAIFVNGVIFWFIKQNTRYCFTAILFYALCFYMRFNCEIMRESLAVSFFLLGYRYLISNKYIKYYSFAFLSFMCHSSAVFIFILPVLYSNVKSIWKIIVGIITIGLVVVISYSYVGSLVSMYMDTYTEYNSTIFGKLSIILFQIIIPIYFYRKSRNFSTSGVKEGVKLYIYCGCASLLFYILYRFNNYTIIFYIILISDLVHSYHSNRCLNVKFVRSMVYSMVFCYGFISPYFTDVSNTVGYKAKWYVCWYPYSSIFDKEINQDRETYIRQLNSYGK
ncbi:EpsG family protein [Parabacteroides sp. ZJ-118]|uniref:EpsG family protein n=1 Tax=Parabacteroides sp. ZJ-118 TaxID=2709398 RepID=UPI0013EAFF56